MSRIPPARFALRALCLAALLGSCTPYAEYNPLADVPVDLQATASRLSFGTSSGGSAENSVVSNADGSVSLIAFNDTYNAGKIAGSEDGLSFFFRQVPVSRNFKLTADCRVDLFGGLAADGSTASNGQEGFGLMARDWVPQYPGFTLADNLNAAAEYHAGSTGGSGNMVMVGGVKRGVRAALRRGVVEPSGACVTDPLTTPDASRSVMEWWPKELGDYSAFPTLEDRPDFPAKNSTYRLSLEKTNSAFIATITPPASKGTTQVYTMPYPDILAVIDPDHYYVGFFAARSAKVTISNVSYFESDCADSPPYLPPPPLVLVPNLTVLSPATNSDGSYSLVCTSNVRGRLSVVQDGLPVPGADLVAPEWVTETANGAVTPYSLFTIPTYKLGEGDNTFQIAFYPDPGQDITSAAALTRIYKVNRRSYFTAATPIHVAPDGKSVNAGTEASPLDLVTAITYVLPGQTIYLADGVYSPLAVDIPRFNDGVYGQPKTLAALHRDKAIIDFQRNYFAKGFTLQGNYWIVDGIHVRNTPDKVKGLTVLGSNDIVRWVKTYGNGDTGLQLSGRSTEPKRFWPKNDIIEYCESFDNLDAAQNDADGFAAKLTVGEGNVFDWCSSHNNCDDGWDLFTKKETGVIGAVTITNCVAYRNGHMMDGTKTYSGRNGFKLGGEGLAVPHVVTNCLAFQNGAHGFTSNSNLAILLSYCTSFDNGGAWNDKVGADSRNFTVYDGANTTPSTLSTLTGVLSIYSDPLIAGTSRKEDKVKIVAPVQGFVWMGDGSGGSAGLSTRDFNGKVLSVADLASTIPPLGAAGSLPRRADGSFTLGDFTRLAAVTAFKTGADLK